MPRPRGRPPTITPEQIVDAAIHLTDVRGPDALSFRKLGQQLGVDHTAFYRHFANKDALLLAIADRLLSVTAEGFEPSGDWRGDLTAFALRLRATYLRHPGAAAFAALRVTRGPGELAGMEVMLRAITSAGLAGAEAAQVYRAFVDLVLSWGALISAYAALPPEVRARDEAAWDEHYRQVPASAAPTVHAMRDDLCNVDDTGLLEVGLEIFFDGIEARLSLRSQRRHSQCSDPLSSTVPARSVTIR